MQILPLATAYFSRCVHINNVVDICLNVICRENNILKKSPIYRIKYYLSNGASRNFLLIIFMIKLSAFCFIYEYLVNGNKYDE